MDLVLAGRFIGAEEAERTGLVSRVMPAEDVLEEVLKTAEIASKPKLVATKPFENIVHGLATLAAMPSF